MKAAVREGIGFDFRETPPGHRFNLYFRIWDRYWEISSKEKKSALDKTLAIPQNCRKEMESLQTRQKALLSSSESVYTMMAISLSPLATGLGNEHPLENGFAFLSPYGIPYLPASSIKGVLRSAARELVASEKEGWSELLIEELFGNEKRSGALTFWDSIPQGLATLAMDVITPHTSHYLQEKKPPHDTAEPLPNFFMVIPSGTKFNFHVTCHEKRVSSPANWRESIEQAFEYAFKWLGFGAKTSVGYGALEIDADAMKQEEQVRKEREEALKRERELARLTPNQRKVSEFESIYDELYERDGHYEAGGRHARFSRMRRELLNEAQEWEDVEDLKPLIKVMAHSLKKFASDRQRQHLRPLLRSLRERVEGV